MNWNFLKPVAATAALSLMLVGCGTTNNDHFDNENNGPLDVRYDTQNNRDLTRNHNDLTYRNNANDRRRVGMNGNTTNRDGFGATNVRNNDRTDTGMNMGRNDGGEFGNHNNRLDVADDIADDVAKVNGVDRAYVMVMGDNAYVGVKLSGAANLNQDLEKKIADQARKTNGNLDHVYVSANPDFFNRMQGYRKDINNGNPVSGFFDEFSEMAERIFPNAR